MTRQYTDAIHDDDSCSCYTSGGAVMLDYNVFASGE